MTHSTSLLGITTHSDLAGFSPSPTVLMAEPGHGLEIPGGNFLLTADFHRVGGDLLLVGKDAHEVVVRDYFASHTPPDLISGTGGVIHSDLAARLAGAIAPGQWAEDGAPQTQLHAIGEIQKLSGVVKVHHIDGRVEILQQGATVFQGDVLETAGDGAVGIVFADRSTFSLGKNGRMVMDELVYDPQSHTGHSSMSVVQGTFSFVSGQIAKSAPDAMSVKTPVMTIGIRGTTVAGTAAAEGSQNTVALLSDEDGGVGQIVVANEGGAPQILTFPNQAIQMISAFQAPPPPVILPPQQLQTLIPELQIMHDIRPPQPAVDPHINTSATSGNTTATASPQSTTPAPTPPATPAEAAAAANAAGGTLSIPVATVLDATKNQTQDAVAAVTSGDLMTHSVDPVVQTETQAQSQRASNDTANNASAASAAVETSTAATPTITAPIAPPTTTTTTTTLTNTPTTTTGSVSTLVGSTGADILAGGSGTNVFFGHGGSDTYILGSSSNIVMLDNNAHDEVVIDSGALGVHNVINVAGLAKDGFAGFSENSSGDLVVYYNDAAGGGTTTFKNYYGSDPNVLSVMGGHGADVMTFLKDDTGASSATVVYNSQTATMHEIVGDGNKDLILAHGDSIVVLASSNVVSSQSGGNMEVVVQGLGDIIVANPDGHNAAFFNHMTDSHAMTFDLTGLAVHDLTVNGAALTASNNGDALFTTGPETASTASGATTYMYGINSVYGTDNGDKFVGGMLYEGYARGQEFYAGSGSNIVVDIGYSLSLSHDYQYNNAAVTVSYAESTSGITANLSLDMSQNIESHGYYLDKSGYVIHGLVTDALYDVWDVQGSAHNDVFYNSGNRGAFFFSSLGNDHYTGNGSSEGAEVSYEDAGAPVTINLSGSAQNGLASGQALHDGGYTDTLSCIEEVRLAADYSSKLYGDGTVVLDMSSTSFDGMTANLSTGKVYGWEAGVTDSFQNIGGLKDTVGGADFIVTSANIETHSIVGNYTDSTLDLTALGASVHLFDSVTNSVHSGTAFLIGASATTELVYSGITELDTNIPTIALTISGDTLDLSAATAGVTATLSDYGSAYAGSAGSANGATASFANIDVVVGSSHADLLTGSPNTSSTLFGGGGADTIVGGDNDDILVLNGTSGGTIIGTGGFDTMLGASGNDVLMASSGTAVLDGKAGQDLLSMQDASAGVTVDLADHYVTGGVSANFQNIEIIKGTTYDDLFHSYQTGTTFIGGGGNDEVSFTSTVTVDMSAGHAWSTSAGTDTLIDISNVSSGFGVEAHYIVTSASLAVSSISAAYGDSTLDFSHLANGVTAYLANHSVNGHDSGQALLVSATSTAVLNYGVQALSGSYTAGIGTYDYGDGTWFDLTTACLVDQPTTDVQVDFSSGLASFNGASYHLVGTMPSDDNAVGFYLSDAVSTFSMKGSLEQLSNAAAEIYGHNGTASLPSLVLEITDSVSAPDTLFDNFSHGKIGRTTVDFDAQATAVLGEDAANANLEQVNFHVGSGNSIDATFDAHVLTIHLNGTDNLVTGSNYTQVTLDLTGGSLSNILTDTVSNVITLRADDVTGFDLTGIVPQVITDGFYGIDLSRNGAAMTITTNLSDLSNLTLAGGGNGANQLVLTDSILEDNQFQGLSGFPTLVATNVETISLDYAAQWVGITHLDLTQDSADASLLNIESNHDTTITLTENQFLNAAAITGNSYEEAVLSHLVITNVSTEIDDTAFESSRFSGIGSILLEGSSPVTVVLGTNAGASNLEWVGFGNGNGNTLDASSDAHDLTVHLSGTGNKITGNSNFSDVLDLTGGALSNLLTDTVALFETLRVDDLSGVNLAPILAEAISDGFAILDFSHDTLAMTVTAELGNMTYIVDTGEGYTTAHLALHGGSSGKNQIVATDGIITDARFGFISNFETLAATQASVITLGSTAASEGITNVNLTQDANLVCIDTSTDDHDVTIALTRSQLLDSDVLLYGNNSGDYGLSHLVITDGSAEVNDSVFAASRFRGVVSMEFETAASLTLGSYAAESGLHTLTLNSTGHSTVDATSDAYLWLVKDYWGYLNYLGCTDTGFDYQSHTVVLGYGHLGGDSVDAGVGHNFLNIYVDANSAIAGVNALSEAVLAGNNLANFETLGLTVNGYDMVSASLGATTADSYPTVILDLRNQYAGAFFDLSGYTSDLGHTANLVIYAGNQNHGMEYITLGLQAEATIIGSGFGSNSDRAVISLADDISHFGLQFVYGSTSELYSGGDFGHITLSGEHSIQLAGVEYGLSTVDEYSVFLNVDAQTGITGLLAGATSMSTPSQWGLSGVTVSNIEITTLSDNCTIEAWNYCLASDLINGLDTVVLTNDNGNYHQTVVLSVGYDPGGWNNIATETLNGDLTLNNGAHVAIETSFQGGVLSADQLADGGSGHFTAGGDLNLYAMTSDTPVGSDVAHIMTMTEDKGSFAHITGLDAYASSAIVLELTYYETSIDLTSHEAILATTSLTEGTSSTCPDTLGVDYIVGNGSGGQTLSGGGGADEILAVGNNNEVIVGDNSFKYLDGGGSGSELEFAFSTSGTINLTGSGVVTPATATGGTHRSDSVEHFDMLDLTNSHGSTLVLNEAAVYSIANTGNNALLGRNSITDSSALIIGGKTGDALQLNSTSQWNEDYNTVSLTVNGQTNSYQVYHSSGDNGHSETVYVESHVAVTGQIQISGP